MIEGAITTAKGWRRQGRAVVSIHRVDWRHLGEIARAWAAQEQGRFLLWAPLWLIVGIAAYFRLTDEPPGFLGLLGVILVGGGALACRCLGWEIAARVGRIGCVVIAGFALAQLRTAAVAAPIVPWETGGLAIQGTLLSIEDRDNGRRLLIAPEPIWGLPDGQTPARVRVIWRGAPGVARPGDIVRLRAVLRPPPPPVRPGGFDYGRMIFFERIGAVGFSYTAAEVVRPARGWQHRLTQWRASIADQVQVAVGGRAGAVAAAITTGDRSAIPEAVTEALRATGLAHLLAISGLHMGLVCGFIFFTSRLLLAAVPAIAARVPAKKAAALAGLVGGVIYLGLSGGAWSAQRAFIMAAISFIAILCDRRAISLRNVALAALVILIYRPEAVMSAGFQMSFTAVTALVAAYGVVEQAQRRWPAHAAAWRQPNRKPVVFFAALCLTSLVAGAATGPHAIYHFGRVASFGLVANLLAMPIMTLAVMPLAVLGLIAMPFGLDGALWWLVGKGLGAIIWIAEGVAAWPGAVVLVPQWPPESWALATLAVILASVLAAPWRVAALALAPLGLWVASAEPRPVAHIAQSAKNVAVIAPPGEPGAMALHAHRRGKFAAEKWMLAHGISGVPKDLPKFSTCAEGLCLTPIEGGVLAVAETRMAGAKACQTADIVVIRLWAAQSVVETCAVPIFTAATDAVDIYRQGEAFVFRHAETVRGDRPWVP